MAKKRGGKKSNGFLTSAIMFIVLISAVLGWSKSNDINSLDDGYGYFKSWSDKAWDCGAGEAKWTCDTPGSKSGDKKPGKGGSDTGDKDNGEVPSDATPKKEVLANLEKVSIAPPAEIDYNRGEWKHWTGSPCDTRETVLKKQGKDVKTDPKTCKTLSGSWVDPYSGDTFTESSKMDLDHLVALSYAARHGGQDWSAAKKEKFANDQSQLLISSATENRKKSDKGPSDYMPPNRAFHCEFSKKWVATTLKYELSITEKDKRALKTGLQKC